MIEKIEIAGCATYGDAIETLAGLKEINFIYGPNGSGKTTISRLIANADHYPASAIHWKRGTKLETLVYNSDFVQENFNQSKDLKGIFTVGQRNIEVQKNIESAKAGLDELTRKSEHLIQNLEGDDGKGGKIGELLVIEEKFEEVCWKLKVIHDEKLQGALSGYRGDKQKFKKRLLEECAKTVTTPIPSQSDLETRAATVFGVEPTTEQALSALNEAEFLVWESNPILRRRVLGKSDVDIAGMIQKLGNSDWVKQGIPYFESNDGNCPFCQQKAPTNLKASLEEYFDETFLKDSQEIAAMYAGYKLEGERLQQSMQTSLSSALRFLDSDKLATEKQVFESRFKLNLQRVETKVKEPSQIIEIEPTSEILARIRQILADANSRVSEHNKMVSNLASERAKLTSQTWMFLAKVEIAGKYQEYIKEKEGPEKAISSLQSQIRETRNQISQKAEEIRTLEKSVTSVIPTVNEINGILQGFGFRNFSIEATESNSYRLRRADGSDAKDTLSEGERGFITFLYFYHLLKGSNNDSGITKDRVAVFDDPVSSLDSDVLFIVSSLIKQTIQEAKGNKGLIKQVIVLTHNVYFHKEITFENGRSAGVAFKEETFWTIRKQNGVSRVKQHTTNPIKTSYDLLWMDIKGANLENQSIQNSMRRILEHYFRILGGFSLPEILDIFDGEEKLVCRSLLSWVHDGSHSVPDDMFHTLDEAAADRYLEVFRKIFVKMGHANHYNMMMGLPCVFESVATVAP